MRNPLSKLKSEPGTPFFERRLLVTLIIVAAALLPRLILLVEVAEDTFFHDPVMDSQVYDDWAWTIVSGEYHGEAELYLEGSYYMGPLYAYFLVLIYGLFGHSILAACIIGILIGAATALLIHRAARMLYGPVVAFFAGLVAALYPALIFYDVALLMEGLLVFFAALMLNLIIVGQRRDRWYHWLGAGMCIGLSALGRGNILLFAPVLALWVFLGLWKKMERPGLLERLKEQWRPGFKRALLLTGGVLLFVAPATIHNAVVGEEFVLTTANGGINFYIGNNELATGEYVNPGWIDVKYDPGGRAYVQGQLGERVSYGRASRWWSEQAWEWIGDNPGRWLGLTATKALFFVHRHEIMQVANIHVILGRETPALFFGVLFSLALAAFVWDRERRREMGAWWLFALLFAVSVILFFITARYRLPFIVAAIPPAVWAVGELVRRIRSGGKALLRGAALLLPVLAVTNIPLSAYGIELVGNEAALANNRGTIYLERGGGDFLRLARDEFERGIRANPRLYPLHTNLGLVFYRFAHHPDTRTPELYQSLLNRARLNFENALSIYPDPKAMLMLGDVLIKQGRLDEARLYLERAFELIPGDPRAAYSLGICYSWIGANLARDDAASLALFNFEKAAAVFQRGLAFNPDNPDLLFALGALFHEELDRSEDALPLLERFLETRPWTSRHNDALGMLEEMRHWGGLHHTALRRLEEPR